MFFSPPPPPPAPLSRRDYWWLAAILLVFVSIAAIAAHTKAAGNDEGVLGDLAWTLVSEGRMMITIMIDKGNPGQGMDKRAFLVPPLYPLVMAEWFRLFGRSLEAMRWVSILFGTLGIGAMFLFLDRLTARRRVALMGAGILALTYVYLDSATYGRYDMMTVALGLSGWAAYVYWRQERLDLAVLVSQTLIVLSGISHWCGIFWALGLYVLTAGWDFRRLRLRHLGLAAIPYLIAGAGWGTFILKDPHEFQRQFFGSARASGRMSGLSAPWMGVWREFTERYPVSYGLAGHMAGNRGPIFLKACMLAAYIAAVIACMVWKPLQKRKERIPLLLLTGLFFLLLGIIEGQKLSLYLVHIVPLYTGLLALAATEVYERGRAHWLLAVLAVTIAVDAGGMLYRSRQNVTGNIYNPVGQAIREHAPAGSRVYGHNSLYFVIDDAYIFRDDSYLGYLDGKVPDYYIMELTWETIHAEEQQLNSELWRHIDSIKRKSRLVYRNAAYAVYEHEKQ